MALTTDAIFMMMSVGIDQRDRLLAVALACEMDYAPYMRHRVEIIESDGNTYRTRTVLDVPCEEPTKHLITDLAFSIDCRHLFLEVNSGFLTRVWDLDEEQELGPPVPQEILGKRAPFNHPEQVAIASKKDGGTPVRVPLVSSKGRESSRSAESWPMRMLQKGLDFSLLSENQQVVATIPNDMTFGICWPRRRLWINTDDGYLSMLELELGGSP